MARQHSARFGLIPVLALMAAVLGPLPAAAVQPDDTLLFVGETIGQTSNASRLTTVRADGTGVRTLAEKEALTAGNIGAAEWSPDGRRVAFAEFDHEAGTANLVLVNRAATSRHVLSNLFVGDLAWSPDGTRLAAAGSVNDNHGIWVFAADGSSSSQILTGAVEAVDWSPDGTQLAYAVDTSSADGPPRAAIETVRPDGAGRRALTDGSFWDRDPQWSPDGQRVAFLRLGLAGQDNVRVTELRTVAADGSDAQLLAGPQDHDADHESILDYDWSPDGARIVYNAAGSGFDAWDADLYVARSDGSGTAVLLDTAELLSTWEPIWSPDGRSVAFVRLRQVEGPAPSDSEGIHLVEADGSNVRLVYDNFDSHAGLRFSPRVDSEPSDERVTTEVPASTDGQPVVVTATMPAGTVQVTFEQVEEGGSLTVVQRAATEDEQRPGFTALDTAFDVSVSGVAFASAEVCVPFDAAEAEAAGLTEDELRLYHIADDGVRRDVTTTVDTDAGQLCGRASSFSPFLVGVSRLDRLAGPDRVSTAAAVAAATFPPSPAVAYVATHRDYPDALAGGPAATRTGGPILLVTPSQIPASTAAGLTRLQPDRIVVLGGPAAVSTSVESQLAAYTDGRVTRLGGEDRYETAAMIAEQHFTAPAAVAYVATGRNFPDALAGGAAAAAEGAPVLLVGRDTVPPATAAALEELTPGGIIVLGGPEAVSDAVRTSLEDYTQGSVTRIFGQDRYETAAEVLKRFDAPTEQAYVATGMKFPDALAAVPAAGLTGSPLALVKDKAVPSAIQAQLDRLQPDRLFVLGGHAAVAPSVEEDLAASLRQR